MDDNERFNPELLTLARRTRGLSQAQTSSKAEVAQSFISKYESGTMMPRDQHIEKLAQALDYPTAFFYQQMVIRGPGISLVICRRNTSGA